MWFLHVFTGPKVGDVICQELKDFLSSVSINPWKLEKNIGQRREATFPEDLKRQDRRKETNLLVDET